jgi:hypothetical protein
MNSIGEKCLLREVFSWPLELIHSLEKKARQLAIVISHFLRDRDERWNFVSQTTTASPLLSELKFEKFVINKDHQIRKVDRSGAEIPLGDRDNEVHRPDFFAGSMAISRNPEHTSKVHKTIYTIQSVNSKVFRSNVSGLDVILCHAMIILGDGKASEQYPVHPFSIAHADLVPGIFIEDSDPLQQDDVSELIIYRPIQEEIRNLYKQYAMQTASTTSTNNLRARVFRRIEGRYSLYDAATAMFTRTVISSGSSNSFLDRQMTQKTASLIADLLLNEPIKNRWGLRRNFICSGYANSVLQGAIFIRELNKHEKSVVLDFLQDDGQVLSRKRLVDKIYRSLLEEDESDPIARSLYQVYQQIALTRLDVCQAMPIYVDRLIGELID